MRRCWTAGGPDVLPEGGEVRERARFPGQGSEVKGTGRVAAPASGAELFPGRLPGGQK
jgi:hypothetical protein